MLTRCLVYILFFSTLTSEAQFYSLGQNPSSTKWRQIKTQEFQLIFPEDFESRAQEVANLLEYASLSARKSLKTKPRKISIIIQNNTTVDNGFVTLAPKRSEFFGTPSQENTGVDWLKKLAVHEYRHVVQLEKFNEGVGKVLKLMFGQQGMGALILLTTPLWMMEGDAVHVETEFTERGRGRYGPFLREFEAQISELDSMSYEKAVFGSFRDAITDHYKIGYYLSEFVSETYGREIWDSVLHKVVRNPFPPYPFSYYLKKITGRSTSQLYADLIANKKRLQKHEAGFYESTPKEIISKEHTGYVSYENPVLTNDSAVIALKKSFDKPIRFVKLKNNKEEVIHVPGVYDENTFSYNKEKIIWAEKRKHPRWDYLDYSEIIVFDLKSKKRHRIKRKTRWFSPVISPDGTQIAVIEIDKVNTAFLVLLDFDGNEVQRLILTEKNAYHLNWYSNNKIAFTMNDNGAGSLAVVDLKERTVKKTISFTKPLSYPTPYKSGFLVQTLDNNKDCIAFISTETQDASLNMVINPEFGLDFIAVDHANNEIIYADYHSQGSVICKSEIEIGEKLAFNSNPISPRLNQKVFEKSKYRPLLNLFNFHSWAPISVNPSSEDANLGASIFSQNLLSSSILSLNYDYFLYTGASKWMLDYKLEHFYPAFFIKSIYSMEPNSSIQDIPVDIQSINYQGGVDFDLYYDGSKFRKYVFLKGAYVYDEAAYDFGDTYRDTLLIQENTQWFSTFAINHKLGKRDIYSPWSILVSSAYYFNVKSNQNAQVFNFVTTVPGVFKNDGLKFSVGKQWGTDVFVPNFLKEPRGTLNQSFTSGDKFSVEYGLPLWYPDLKISRLAYVQRLRANFFYDYLTVFDDVSFSDFSSVGGTLFLDFNPLKYSYLSVLALQFGKSKNGGYFFGPSFKIIY